MTSLSPLQAAKRLRRAVDRLPQELEAAGRAGLKRWSGRAVGSYMRDAKGEGRRRSDDDGELRIVTGEYARSLTSGRNGAINRLESDRSGVRLILGADPEELPQVYNETGATVKSGFGMGRQITIPARPTIEPALADEIGEIQGLFKKRLRRLLQLT